MTADNLYRFKALLRWPHCSDPEALPAYYTVYGSIFQPDSENRRAGREPALLRTCKTAHRLCTCVPPPSEEPPNWESEPDQIQWTTKGSHYRGMNEQGVEAGGAEVGAVVELTKSLD